MGGGRTPSCCVCCTPQPLEEPCGGRRVGVGEGNDAGMVCLGWAGREKCSKNPAEALRSLMEGGSGGKVVSTQCRDGADSWKG